MSTITVETECGKEQEFDSRPEAEEAKRTHESLCDDCSGDEIRVQVRPDGPVQQRLTNGGDRQREELRTENGEPVHDDGEPAVDEPAEPALPRDMPESVRTDPLDVVPEYMISRVEGQPTINKRGYAVIANHFDIVVRSEPVTTAGETDHEYAEFRATAWKKGDGPEQGYTGTATARATEDRRGIENNLNEMAETRAMKRAVAWASGVGLLAWEEMVEYVDDDSTPR